MIEVLSVISSKKPAYLVGFQGQGGVGKSALAKEICQLFSLQRQGHLKDYWDTAEGEEVEIKAKRALAETITSGDPLLNEGIIWLRLDDRRSLAELLSQQLAPIVTVKGAEFKDIEPHKLCQQLDRPGLLVVIDSAEQNIPVYEELIKLFKQSVRLVTSRKALTLEKGVSVSGLPRNEASHLFKKILDRTLSGEEEKALDNILELIGDLPLAIHILAHKVRKHISLSLCQLHEQLEEAYGNPGRFIQILEEQIIEEHMVVQASIATSFLLSFNGLSELSKELFMNAAVFAHPFARGEVTALLPEGAGDDQHLIDKSFKQLTDSYLFEVLDVNDQIFQLHPLLGRCGLAQLEVVGRTDDVFNAKWERYKTIASSHNLSDRQLQECQAVLEESHAKKIDELWVELTKKLMPIWRDRGLWPLALNWGAKAIEKSKQNEWFAQEMNIRVQQAYLLLSHQKREEGRAVIRPAVSFLGTKKPYSQYCYLRSFINDTHQWASLIRSDFSFVRQLLKIDQGEDVRLFYQDFIEKLIHWGWFDRAAQYQRWVVGAALADSKQQALFEVGRAADSLSSQNKFVQAFSFVERFHNERYTQDVIISRIGAGDARTAHIQSGNFDAARDRIDDALELARLTSDEMSQNDLCFTEAEFWLRKGDYSQAKKYLNQFQPHNPGEVASVAQIRGELHLREGQFEKALASFQQELDYYEKEKNPFQQLDGLSFSAWAYAEMGNHEEALLCWAKAEERARFFGTPEIKSLLEAREKIPTLLGVECQLPESKELDNYPWPPLLMHNLPEQHLGEDKKQMLLVPEGHVAPDSASLDLETLWQWVSLDELDSEQKSQLQSGSQNTHLYPFYVDETPVTWREYSDFCQQTDRALPNDFGALKDAEKDQPMLFNRIDLAQSYAGHFNKRIPVQEEWQHFYTHHLKNLNTPPLLNEEQEAQWKEFSKSIFVSPENIEHQLQWLQDDPPPMDEGWVNLLLNGRSFVHAISNLEWGHFIRELFSMLSLSLQEKQQVFNQITTLSDSQFSLLLESINNEQKDCLKICHKPGERKAMDGLYADVQASAKQLFIQYFIHIQIEEKTINKDGIPWSPWRPELGERGKKWLWLQQSTADAFYCGDTPKRAVKPEEDSGELRSPSPFHLRCVVPAWDLIPGAKIL